jgi:hypothetical protein
VRRYEKERKAEEKVDKDDEIIAFIDLLFDLFPYNQYCDRKKKKSTFLELLRFTKKNIFVL